jgi:hypothetical protein
MEYDAVVDYPIGTAVQADAVAERVGGEIEIFEISVSPEYVLLVGDVLIDSSDVLVIIAANT